MYKMMKTARLRNLSRMCSSALAIAMIGFASAHAARVQVIVAGDTNDRRIGKDVNVDIGSFRSIFDGWQDTRVMQPHVLDGDRCTPDNIVAALESLSLQPNDAVVFYYAGHGANDADQGDFLQFPRLGEHVHLLRSQIRDRIDGWVKARQIRLGVIITDMCNQSYVLPPAMTAGQAPMTQAGPPPRKLLLESLFLYSSGLLDINAADTGEVAMNVPAVSNQNGISYRGGVFTSSLVSKLQFAALTPGNWQKVLDDVQSDMKQMFRISYPNGVNTPTGFVQMTQTIKRMSIADTQLPPSGFGPAFEPDNPNGGGGRSKRLGVTLDPVAWRVQDGDRWIFGQKVNAVQPGTPAFGVIDPGDIILSVNGRETPTHADLLQAIENAGPILNIFGWNVRTQRAEQFPLSISMNAIEPRGFNVPAPGNRELGVILQPGSVPVTYNGRTIYGQRVMNVKQGTPAFGRIDPGDIILTVNGQATPNHQTLLNAITAGGSQLTIEGWNVRTGRVEIFPQAIPMSWSGSF